MGAILREPFGEVKQRKEKKSGIKSPKSTRTEERVDAQRCVSGLFHLGIARFQVIKC